MFSNILVPTDGSKGSLRAASIVADLARHNLNAKVTIICAISLTRPEDSDLDPEVVEQKNSGITHAAENALGATKAIFDQAGVTNEAKIISGDPVSHAIVLEAKKGNFDVIAMATHGMTHQHGDRHYFGSVTDHVLRQVDVPVLVLPVRENI